MPKTFADGLATIRGLIKQRTIIGKNNCKLRTREAFDVPSNGTPNAATSWDHAPDKHHSTDPTTWPANTFGWLTGGSEGDGHVWVNLGGGKVLTPGGPTDPYRWVETTALAVLHGWPNLRPAGWTRTIDGQAPTLTPKPNHVTTGRSHLDDAIAVLSKANPKRGKVKVAVKALKVIRRNLPTR